jgi:DNA primase
VYTSGSGASSVFEVIREAVPIGRLIWTNGHRKALCVSHSEKDPSMHVYEYHVHCYGCGFHGDVVDVWAAQKGIDRPIEAALDLAREFNVRLPEMSEEGRQKAEERRIKEDSYLEMARVCYRALTVHDAVREWWEGRGFGNELRVRFLLGSNEDGTEAVIPFWRRGKIVGLIHRNLQGEPKYKVAKGKKPLFIPNPISRDVFLVEGYVDALAIAATGKNVIAVGGTKMSDDQLQELRSAPSRYYVLTDADEKGAEAACEWGTALYPQTFVCSRDYGKDGKDAADLLPAIGVGQMGEHLEKLIASAKDPIDLETDVLAEMGGDRREKLAYAIEHIVPMMAKIASETMREATATVVSDRVKGLNKGWLDKAIKEDNRLFVEDLDRRHREEEELRRRLDEEHRAKIVLVQDEIDERVARPGVLERLRNTAALMHNVRRDENALELALLVALGAQLEPLPNGRPLGASILLTAQAGRGKNHIFDAAVKPLPEEFYFAFEKASGQSFYYLCDEDPDFLRHRFCYPNEIEGVEDVWEFLRPMLSKASAHKLVTAKDPDGNSVSRQITVRGPVTIAIPTIRNKTDEQLQTRLLVAELPDYVGRVKEHSLAISAQLLPDAVIADFEEEVFLWQEGLRQLTEVRRVVFPMDHPDFALNDDQISHGARLWANLLSLMATNAWLEQKNRRILELKSGARAVEATPDDYEVAYGIFNAVCKRTVVNLSDTHRKILDGLYELLENNPERDAFAQREIAKAAGVALSTVSDNKTFLVMSAKLMKESDYGLTLVEGAEPSWWQTGELMGGLPTPEQVRAWWEDKDPEPPEGAEHTEHPNKPVEQDPNPRTYGDSGVRHPAEQEPNAFGPEGAKIGVPERVREMFDYPPNTENGLGKPNEGDEGDRVRLFGTFTDTEG